MMWSNAEQQFPEASSAPLNLTQENPHGMFPACGHHHGNGKASSTITMTTKIVLDIKRYNAPTGVHTRTARTDITHTHTCAENALRYLYNHSALSVHYDLRSVTSRVGDMSPAIMAARGRKADTSCPPKTAMCAICVTR